MSQKFIWLIVVLLVIIALLVGYLYGGFKGEQKGYDVGYDAGYSVGGSNKEDLINAQKVAAEQALDEAVRAANPFKTENPLQGVEINPLKKVKDELNPF